jgi:chondroitin AC lyase
VGGLLPDRSRWGPRLVEAITGLIDAKSDDTIIRRERELLEYKSILEENDFVDELTLNQPFWNIDYIIHRRPDYFASAKMISTRSRGLERGIDRRSYYYLGDGALFVRVHRDDYNALSDVLNWHAIPGTTAEQRKDKLPPDADSPFPGAPGTNTFAGVVSDGQYGFGAFIYERNHVEDAVNYSTVNAHKSYFFFEREIVALGGSIRRVRPGDDRDIWTTLNQVAWNGTITYQVDGNRVESVPKGGAGVKRELTVDDSVAWFHQDQIGYVIIPTGKPVHVELLAEPRAGGRRGQDGTGIDIFQLAINHGPNPTDDEYRYILLPNVTAEDVERFARDVDSSAGVHILSNDKKTVAVRHNALGITQIAFYEPGRITAPFGKDEEICLSVDRPALVMLREDDAGLEITVTDPNHSTSEPTIMVETDRDLRGPGAHYDSIRKATKIDFTHSAAEVYAGKPMFRSYRVAASK